MCRNANQGRAAGMPTYDAGARTHDRAGTEHYPLNYSRARTDMAPLTETHTARQHRAGGDVTIRLQTTIMIDDRTRVHDAPPRDCRPVLNDCARHHLHTTLETHVRRYDRTRMYDRKCTPAVRQKGFIRAPAWARISDRSNSIDEPDLLRRELRKHFFIGQYRHTLDGGVQQLRADIRKRNYSMSASRRRRRRDAPMTASSNHDSVH